ncbi:hypothetical protein ACWGDE_07445, partial [Streptomyces sp. NPDC054956]
MAPGRAAAEPYPASARTSDTGHSAEPRSGAAWAQAPEREAERPFATGAAHGPAAASFAAGSVSAAEEGRSAELHSHAARVRAEGRGPAVPFAAGDDAAGSGRSDVPAVRVDIPHPQEETDFAGAATARPRDPDAETARPHPQDTPWPPAAAGAARQVDPGGASAGADRVPAPGAPAFDRQAEYGLPVRAPVGVGAEPAGATAPSGAPRAAVPDPGPHEAIARSEHPSTGADRGFAAGSAPDSRSGGADAGFRGAVPARMFGESEHGSAGLVSGLAPEGVHGGAPAARDLVPSVPVPAGEPEPDAAPHARGGSRPVGASLPGGPEELRSGSGGDAPDRADARDLSVPGPAVAVREPVGAGGVPARDEVRATAPGGPGRPSGAADGAGPRGATGLVLEDEAGHQRGADGDSAAPAATRPRGPGAYDGSAGHEGSAEYGPDAHG